jgi:pimeloyl-ACP methyl ester carboxylesterase
MGFVDLSDGGRLAYDDAGEGSAVVFLHPGLWDRRVWDRQMVTFGDAAFRTVRYDLRGYGASSRPTDRPYSHVRDLVELLNHLEIRQAALVGCSTGGEVAIDVTVTEVDRVWGLVAVASGLSGFEPLEEEDDWWEAAMKPVEAALEAGDLELAQELRLRIWAPLGLDDEAGAKIRAIAFDNLHELTMDESAQQEIEPPAALRLAQVDVPTLVLIPDHDPPYMRRVGDLIARGVPEARKVVVEDADHVVNVRRPDIFDAEVIPFLVDAAPRPRSGPEGPPEGSVKAWGGR